MAGDVHVNDRADFSVPFRVSHFARGPVIVIAEVVEMGADFVRHLEVVNDRNLVLTLRGPRVGGPAD